MRSDATVAVESPPISKQRKEPARRRKKQPPYAVVLFNDEEHTFRYVIEMLTKVFVYP